MEEIAVVKKRGRPAKGGSAAASAAPAAGSPIETIPKKRGRPSKQSKGRGRPPKVISAIGSDNEDNNEALEELAANGDAGEPIKSKGRGRPRKEPIVMHGDSSDNDDDDDDGDSVKQSKPAKRQPKSSSAKRRKLGRPRKHQPSDEDDDDDEEFERRPVGRPPTGAINLNIERTGRGAGRPKKVVVAGSNGDEPVRKRGRPALSNKGPYVPSGKPRGRPKSNNTSLKVAADEPEPQADESEREGEETEESTAVMSTPKKRGRPSLSERSSSAPTGKPRGRPKAPKSQNIQQDNDDAEEQDSTTELDDESNSNVSKHVGKRGRPGKESGTKDANGEDDDEFEDSSGGDNHSEEAVKLPPRKIFKSDAKKDKSSEELQDAARGEETAGHDNDGSVECISDELADA